MVWDLLPVSTDFSSLSELLFRVAEDSLPLPFSYFRVPEFRTVLAPLSSLSPVIAEGAKTMTNTPEAGTK